MLSLEAIRAARERISGGVAHTGCPASIGLASSRYGKIYLKTELNQPTGSFKDRGALNKLIALGREARRRGVVAASAGNHAQALAYHARRLGVPCTVVMPDTAPLIKASRCAALGAKVVQAGETLSDGLPIVRRFVERDGHIPISAFDDPEVVAGQGTIGMEILEQAPELDTVVAPIGGGGLISGIALALRESHSKARLVGVEAKASPGARASLDAGRPVRLEHSDTLADGIAVKRIGDIAFPIIQRYVDDVVLVDEAEIVQGIFYLLESEKLLVEGGGAVGIAAILAGKIPIGPGSATVCVLSGGNIDMNVISRVIDRGLLAAGRLGRLKVVVRDRPGYLNEVTALVATKGANVLEIEHARAFGDVSVGQVEIEMTVELKGPGHLETVRAGLEELGHRVATA